jgi:hypothetical protein
MLHQIVLQLAMGIYISNLLTHGKKSSKYGRQLLIKSRKRTLTVIQFTVNYRMLPFTLNDHIVHSHTCIHDLPHLIFRPGKCREPDNSESSMEHAKCSLNIFPASLLILRKPRLFTSWHSAYDCLHKCCTSWIDA